MESSRPSVSPAPPLDLDLGNLDLNSRLNLNLSFLPLPLPLDHDPMTMIAKHGASSMINGHGGEMGGMGNMIHIHDETDD
mmetsp:Transcript_16783/g.48880  ORF Transcript_16783/g.48880 Transcript_16783/m.48880 type:complete len:80 (-) Transcript_16783:28-267(-)